MSPNKILNSAISETKIKLIEDIKTVLDNKSIQEKNEPLKLSDLTDVSVDYIRKFTGKVDELNETFIQSLKIIAENLSKSSNLLSSISQDFKLSSQDYNQKELKLLGEIELLKKENIYQEENHKREFLKAQLVFEEKLKISGESHKVEMIKIEESYQKLLKEKDSLKNSLEMKIESLIQNTTHNEFQNESLINLIKEKESLLSRIKVRCKEISESQSYTQTNWKMEELRNEPEEIKYIELIIYQLTKLSNDNSWLVERLAEFGKENEKIKQENLEFSKKINLPLIKEVE